DVAKVVRKRAIERELGRARIAEDGRGAERPKELQDGVAYGGGWARCHGVLRPAPWRKISRAATSAARSSCWSMIFSENRHPPRIKSRGRHFRDRALPRLGVTDHSLDRGKARAQPALDVVDLFVHVVDPHGRIDVAMEIDDLAVGRLAHAHLVDVAQHAAIG